MLAQARFVAAAGERADGAVGIGECDLIRHGAAHDGVAGRAVHRQVDHPVFHVVCVAFFGDTGRDGQLLERIHRPGAVPDGIFPVCLWRQKPAAYLSERQHVRLQRDEVRAQRIKRAVHGRVCRADHALVVREPNAEIVVHCDHLSALAGKLAADVDQIAVVQVKAVVIIAVSLAALGEKHAYDGRNGRRFRRCCRSGNRLRRGSLHTKTNRMLHLRSLPNLFHYL